MNRFIMTMCMAVGMFTCHAQNIKKDQREFDKFRLEVYRDFESFRTEIMRDYIEFVKNPWKEFESVPPVPKPKVDPVPPVVWSGEDKDTTRIKDNPIFINDVINPNPVIPQPQPIEKIPEKDNFEESYLNMSFYGTPLKIRYFKNKDYQIGKISEKNVANALTILATDKYDNSIIDCINIRKEYRLCDWAYLQFIQQISDQACGKSSNEATLLAAYLLMQSGYKIRIASSGDRLYLLYASNHCIYERSPYMIDGDFYYGLAELPSKLYISKASFPKEQCISLQISEQPVFSVELNAKRVVVSRSFPAFKVEVQTNRNLLSFYESYPCSYYNDNYMTQWSQYANTPMDPQIVKNVYPGFKKLLAGLSEKEQVNTLLNWVQTGFDYEYDDKVWGRDRVFFSEESLFYPYCDCEDRSILFTRIVRDLVGLECVLLYYPGHLATAVNFTTKVSGDYIELGGKRFVVCDPTFIGAPVGLTMPEMNNSKAGVIRLN